MATTLLAVLTGCSGSSVPGTAGPASAASPTARSATSSSATTATPTPTPTPTPPPSATSSSTPSSATPTPSRSGVVNGYVPLWPFVGVVDAQAWQRSYRSGGHQPWHLNAGLTALSFTRGYLGFTEITRVIAVHVRTDGAHVAVGYRNPAGRLSTAAILHLVRLGPGAKAPWEVVGSDDRSFTLDTPRYASTVRSPVRVSGLLTGVDEQIVVALRQQWSPGPLARSPGTPAGGVARRWSVTVPFTGAKPGAMTIVASTGGHIQRVERFAITGVVV